MGSYLWALNVGRHRAGELLLPGTDVCISDVKESSQPGHFQDSGSHSSTTSDFNCWDLLCSSSSSEPRSALLDSLHAPLSKADQLSSPVQPLGFPWESQMSCSIKPFIPGTVTQEQLELVPPRSSPNERLLGFIPSQSKLVQVSVLLP